LLIWSNGTITSRGASRRYPGPSSAPGACDRRKGQEKRQAGRKGVCLHVSGGTVPLTSCALYRLTLKQVPLARALSKLGVMSRAQAVERILAGHVRVAGRVVRDPGSLVVPETARIAVSGEAVARRAPLTILLHKPRGVVTTRSDPQGRTTVYDLPARPPRMSRPSAGSISPRRVCCS
jgi:hypothetical protein